MTMNSRQLLGIAWPMSLRMMMLHGIVVIDAYLVSALGETALAAMGLASAIGGVMLGVLMAFANASQILVAQAYGSGRVVALKTVFATGMGINLTMGVLGAGAMLMLSGPILHSFAHSPEIAQEAQRYLSFFALVVLAEAIGQSLSAHFNGCGETRRPFFSYLISLPVNVVVSYVLIHGLFGLPALGVAGAALGSAVGGLVRAGYLIWMFRPSTMRYRSAEAWDAPTFAIAVRRDLRFSMPVAATFISVHVSNSVCMLIYAQMPLNDFAAMTLILPWVNVAGTFGMAWAQGTGIAVAQMLGQGRSDTAMNSFLRLAFRGAYIASAVVATVYLGLVLCSGWLYSGLEDATRAALLTFLPVLLILPFPKGTNAICGNTLRAAGQTVYVMHIFVWAQWLFRVPATAALVLWVGAPAGWVFAVFLGEELVKFPAFHLPLWRGTWRKQPKQD